MSSLVIGVIGASGGLGASTLAAALAHRLARGVGAALLVDGQVDGGGLDVTAGIEHRPGLRWEDLGDLAGPVDPGPLTASLPEQDGVRVLSAGRGIGPLGRPPTPETVLEVVRALRAGQPTVLDLPRSTCLRQPMVELADALVVLVGTHSRGLADAVALVGGARLPLADPPPLCLVIRSRRSDGDLVDLVGRHLEADGVVHLADDDRILRAGERGEWPGGRATALDPALAQVLDVLDLGEGLFR